MGFIKTQQITIKVNPILKDKFMVAVGFLDVSHVLSQFMQDTVREYERHIKQAQPIPVSTDRQGAYDIITKIHGVKITPKEFEEMQSYYPRSRKKNVGLYGR